MSILVTWVLILHAPQGGIHSLKFATQQECESFRVQVEVLTAEQSKGTAARKMFGVCVKRADVERSIEEVRK